MMKYQYSLIIVIMLTCIFTSCNKKSDKKPQDFDDFWGQAIEELQQVPMQEEVIKDSIVNDKEWILYKINSYNNIYFYAWVSTPLETGKFPIKIRFSGMGKGNSDKNYIQNDWFLKEDKFISMMVDVRGQGLSIEQISNNRFLTNGLQNKDSYIYKGAYLDAFRAVEFISQNSKSDKNIIVTGGGQGGTLSIFASAFNSKVTMSVIGFPFFSDIASYNKKKWPMKIFMHYCMQSVTDYFDLIETLSYFDMIYFADKIKTPIFIKSEEIDNITPISGILKFYNKIKIAEKEIHIDSCKGHGCVTNSNKVIELENKFLEKWLLKN